MVKCHTSNYDFERYSRREYVLLQLFATQVKNYIGNVKVKTSADFRFEGGNGEYTFYGELKNESKDNTGKIDLLSYNKEENITYVIELGQIRKNDFIRWS